MGDTYQDIAGVAIEAVEEEFDGHTVELRDGVLHIDGEAMRETLTGNALRPAELLEHADEAGTKSDDLRSYAETILWNAIDRARSEGQTCPRRGDPGPWNAVEGLDYWREEPNGDRTCSFCGSLHWEDFLDACKEVIESDNIRTRLSQSDKSYKVYVKRPDVKNATEGGIKYYKFHTPPMSEEEKSKATAIFRRALEVSREKFGAYMQEMRRDKWGTDE